MDTRHILDQLHAERDRLNQAISALESLDGTGMQAAPARFGRRATTRAARPRRMSAVGRARIAAAAKAMWARRKASAGKRASAKATAAKKAVPARRGMSVAARRKLSAMMKARWAARKKAAKTA